MKQHLNVHPVLLGIIGAAVLLRMGAAFYLGPEVVELPGTFDQISYHNLAIRVLDGHGFSFGTLWWPATPAGEPTAHWSFLYTLFLSGIYAIVGVKPLIARLVQAILVGILMPWLTYRLTLQLLIRPKTTSNGQSEFNHAERIALLAAGISAVYIYFVYYGATLMTESFFFIAILWSFSQAISLTQTHTPSLRGWLHLGLALGVTVLLRQVFLLFIPFLLLWVWWAARPKLVKLIIPLVVMAIMILPFSIRNTLVFDQFVLLNTNSGFAFYWGNHPIYGTRFISILPPEMGTYYDLLPADLLHLNEAALNDAVMDLAVQEILADPGRYLLLSLSRIVPYFKFWPSADSSMISNLSRVGSFALFLPFMLLGLGTTLRYRFDSWGKWLAAPLTLIYLFLAVYTGVHILTWTLIRYRLPLDALLVIFAALGMFTTAERIFARRGRPLVSNHSSSSA